MLRQADIGHLIEHLALDTGTALAWIIDDYDRLHVRMTSGQDTFKAVAPQSILESRWSLLSWLHNTFFRHLSQPTQLKDEGRQ